MLETNIKGLEHTNRVLKLDCTSEKIDLYQVKSTSKACTLRWVYKISAQKSLQCIYHSVR